ncbi:MAG: ABC transporter substrate-binding protein [Candidatus Eremiobacteraeota bacterium]|nr:ABC transporter substrate-binding protein [Candidatus Eremiobacteraeota bacterium]
MRISKFPDRTGIFIMFCLLLFGLYLFNGCKRAEPEVPTFYTAGNWDIPPAYHGNPWAPGGVGAAAGYVYEPLFIYVPKTGEFIPRLGTSFEESEDHGKLTVKLREDVKWHDGRPFTSKDVQTTFYIGYIKNLAIWQNLEGIETPNEYTVIFRWKKISPVNTIRALTEGITSPYHIFGKWADEIPKIMRETRRKDEITAVELEEMLNAYNGNVSLVLKELEKRRKERRSREKSTREILYKYHPKMPVGTGPFKVTRVTATDMVLEKYLGYWSASTVHIDRIRIFRWTSNEVIWSFLMAGEVDAVTPATPYDVAQQIIKKNPGTRLVCPSDLHEVGFIFNCTRAPMSDVNFRKAIAYLLNKDLIRKIAYYYSNPVTDYTTGVIKSYRNRWFSKDFLKSLTCYEYKPEKAEEILKNSGYRRDDRGRWVTPDGAEINLEIVAPAGKTDFVLTAESASSQMTGFGINTKVRVIPEDLFNTILSEYKFDMAVSFGPEFVRFAHPIISYARFFGKGGYIAIRSGFAGIVAGPDGNEINLPALVRELELTVDLEKQKQIVEKLAWVANEYLPFLSIFEKNIMIFVIDGKHVTGWPPDSAPIWSTISSGATYSTIMMKGWLKPAGGERKQ